MAQTPAPPISPNDHDDHHPPSHMPLHFDWRDHTDLLDCEDLTEQEQQEFLETLWSIMVHFVDMGFDLNPLQLLCEQVDDYTGDRPSDVITSEKKISEQFRDATVGQVIIDPAALEESCTKK